MITLDCWREMLYHTRAWTDRYSDVHDSNAKAHRYSDVIEMTIDFRPRASKAVFDGDKGLTLCHRIHTCYRIFDLPACGRNENLERFPHETSSFLHRYYSYGTDMKKVNSAFGGMIDLTKSWNAIPLPVACVTPFLLGSARCPPRGHRAR